MIQPPNNCHPGWISPPSGGRHCFRASPDALSRKLASEVTSYIAVTCRSGNFCANRYRRWKNVRHIQNKIKSGREKKSGGIDCVFAHFNGPPLHTILLAHFYFTILAMSSIWQSPPCRCLLSRAEKPPPQNMVDI